MDRTKAIALEKDLKGKELNSFKVIEFINNGKSAAVFKASKGNSTYAIKVFDNDLIERFGHEIQTKRIEQEISLKNHTIDGLIKIHEGGSTILQDQSYYYLIMDLIDGDNLKDYIQKEEYNEDFILTVLSKIYRATEDLIAKKNIAHRDIKPENIMIDKGGNVILMDLGVLKLIGAKSFSDEEEKQFIGTLRYAPPEFLLRQEEDSIKGWKAVNLYQIGATLHDLIMKKELFIEKTPYSNLVIAIKDDTAPISNTKYSFELLQLTRDLLSKDFKKRLEICSNDRINKIITKEDVKSDNFDNGIDEVLKMRLGHQAKFNEIEKLQRNRDEVKRKQKGFASQLSKTIDNCLKRIEDKRVFSSCDKSKNFSFDTERKSTNEIVQNYIYELKGDLKMGFPQNLFILIRLTNDENNYAEIDLLGIFPSVFRNKSVLQNPLTFFREIYKEKQPYSRGQNMFTIKTCNVFKGNIEFDESFDTYISTQLVNLIHKSLKSVEKNVKEEIEWREKIVKSTKRIITRMTTGTRTILIDKI